MVEVANGGSIDSVDPQYNDTEEIDLTEYLDNSIADAPEIALVGQKEETVAVLRTDKGAASFLFWIIGIVLLIVIIVIWGIRRHGK